MILVDTHVVAWLALDEGKLSGRARSAIDEARKTAGGLAISDITLFELATIIRKGRIQVEGTMDEFLSEIETRFVVFPITAAICAHAVQMPGPYPKDPADRIIGATALVRGLPLLTADLAIREAKVVTTVW